LLVQLVDHNRNLLFGANQFARSPHRDQLNSSYLSAAILLRALALKTAYSFLNAQHGVSSFFRKATSIAVSAVSIRFEITLIS
jgi:hypothetical protein